jgi:hypothetical protein
MAASSKASPAFSLNDLCDELLLSIFDFLDVPDLLAASRVRTCSPSGAIVQQSKPRMDLPLRCHSIVRADELPPH